MQSRAVWSKAHSIIILQVTKGRGIPLKAYSTIRNSGVADMQ